MAAAVTITGADNNQQKAAAGAAKICRIGKNGSCGGGRSRGSSGCCSCSRDDGKRVGDCGSGSIETAATVAMLMAMASRR